MICEACEGTGVVDSGAANMDWCGACGGAGYTGDWTDRTLSKLEDARGPEEGSAADLIFAFRHRLEAIASA